MTRTTIALTLCAALVASHTAVWWQTRSAERARWEAATATERARQDAAHETARQATARLAIAAAERDRLAAELAALSEADEDAGRVALPARSMVRIDAR